MWCSKRLTAHKAALILVTCIGFYSESIRSEVLVVAHPTSPLNSLPVDQVKAIFLGKITLSPNGSPIQAIDQAENSPVKARFYLQVIGKDAAKLTAYWAKQVFSGHGIPPPQIGDDDDINRYVARHPEAIGYVDGQKVDGALKVLYRAP